MSNLLTASRLRSFRACARMHDWEYVKGVRPVRVSEALSFGTLMHLALEAWWSATEDHLTAALAAIAPEPDPVTRVRAEELMRGYDARWLADLPAFEVLAVEAQFTAPLLNPATLAPSRTWLLAGKVDVVVRHRAEEWVGIVEHKTTSDAIDDDSDHYWQKLPLDHQCSIYVVGAEALGFKPDRVLYDVIRKPLIRPLKATPPEARKYTKAGALYANQRDTDESLEEYRIRLREDVAASPARYFARRPVPRLDEQLLEFLADAWQQSRGMREAELAGRAPRNPEECWRFGRCSYWDSCANGLDPLTSPDFVKLKNVHPELIVPEPEAE